MEKTYQANILLLKKFHFEWLHNGISSTDSKLSKNHLLHLVQYGKLYHRRVLHSSFLLNAT